MKINRLKCNLLPVLALAVLLSVPSAVILRTFSRGMADLAVDGDLALLDISTRNAVSGRSFLGPYSRFDFNHPGPAFLFARAPVHYLSGFSGSSSYVTVPLLLAASLVGVHLILRKNLTPGGVALFSLIALLYLYRTHHAIWLLDWNPFVIIFPFLLFLTSSASFSAGNPRWLPLVLLSGSFVAQTHLGGFPVVIIAGLTGITLYLFPSLRDRSGFRERLAMLGKGRAPLWSFWVLVLMWLPVLIEALSSGGGNIFAVGRFIRNTPADASFRQALHMWALSSAAMEMGWLNPGALRLHGVLIHGALSVIALRLLLLAWCARVHLKPGGNRFIGSLAAVVAVTHAAMLVAVIQVRGGLNDYLFTWFSVTAPASWLVVAGTAAGIRRISPGKSALVSISVALLMVPLAISVIKPLIVDGSGPYDPLGYHDPDVEHISRRLEDYLSGGPVESWYIDPEPVDLWRISAGVVNRLSGRGYNVHLDRMFSGHLGVETPPGSRRLLLAEAGQLSVNLVDTVFNDGFLILGVPGEGR